MAKKPFKNIATAVAVFLGVFLLLGPKAQAAQIEVTGIITSTGIVTSTDFIPGQGGFGAWSLQERSPIGTSLGSLGSGAGNPCSTEYTNNAIGVDMDTFASGDGDYYLYAPACGSLTNDYYVHFVRSGGVWSGPLADTPTYIVRPYTPSNGALAASTSVSFSFDYFFNSAESFGFLDTVAIELIDTNVSSAPTKYGIQSISATGFSTYNHTMDLIAGHFYLWRPTIYSSATSTAPVIGDLYSLDVVTRAGSSTPFLSATVGTSTLPDALNLLSFLNVPNLLQTKIPFAYIFQIYDGITIGISSSTAATLPSGTFTWKGPTGATTTTDFFSTTTIGYYFSPSLISAWRAFELAILYITFGYALYLRAKHKDLI